ncbi:MAG: NAD-dependent epimerase/dehydratase family protein [Candidatus Hodarchaeota archaeon]
MDWSEKRVLVTGGAGFIGSHLVDALVEREASVRVADDLSRGRLENLSDALNEIEFEKRDLTKEENCLLVTKGMDLVFNLAASVGGIHFIKEENVGGCIPSLLINAHMLEAARKWSVERFLFTSSACVYRERGLELNQFKEEDAYPANPLTTYGWAKLMGEILCRSYYLDYGLKCSVVRIFNCYGPRENLNPKWSHVIPSLIRKAVLYPEEGFRVLGDGRQERAFLYVKDSVEGLLMAMERAEDADPINLGSEEVVSIAELAERIIELSDKDIQVEYDLSGPQGTNRYCADTDKMKNVLEWSPKVSLEEGLRETYEWVDKELRG